MKKKAPTAKFVFQTVTGVPFFPVAGAYYSPMGQVTAADAERQNKQVEIYYGALPRLGRFLWSVVVAYCG